jgi:glutathione S-transferase
MIRLHHCAQARSFRTLWLMKEMGLEFEVVHRSFFTNELRSEEFLSLSPAGRVPALEIDGQVLFESGAITEYLCETRPNTLYRPPGDAERADWLEWLHFAETIGQHLAALTQQHIVLYEDHMRSPVIMKLEARRLEKVLEVVERAVAQHDYLLPSGFSAVDTNVGYGVLIARRFVPLEMLPKVKSYLERLMARPAFKAAMAEDGEPEIYTRPFYEVPDA